MANLDYYGFEVNDILKQAENDHESIGMVQVNVLPIPDGVLDERGGQSVFWYWTRLIGNREQGKITADIRGSMYHNAISCKLKLTPSGRETDVNGKIQPGKYKISFTNTDYGTLILNDDLRMMISVTTNDSDPNDIEYHSEIVGIGETKQITVEEDFKYVEISVMMTIDELGNPNSPQPEDKERYQASFDIFPFIRRVSMGDAPFEPYKPDLQTQIDEFAATKFSGNLPLTVYAGTGGKVADWSMSGNSSGVGEKTDNLVDVTVYTKSPSVTVSNSSYSKGSIAASTTGANNYENVAWQVPFEDGKTYTISFKNLLAQASGVEGRVCVRKKVSNDIIDDTAMWLSSTGTKTLTYIHSAVTAPDGAYLSMIINGNNNTAAEVSISDLSVVEGAAAPHSFIPGGYQIPLTINGTEKVIYIGSSQLSAGQTITMASTGVDIVLESGDNIIDSTLSNKPTMTVKYDKLKIDESTMNATKAATLLNADLIGVFPSYQLFPLDKGTIEAPNEIDKTVCKFVTLSEFANHSTIPPCLICVGQTDDTTLTDGEFIVGFNFDYKGIRGFDLLGDILPGTYQFSMEIFDDSGFTNVGVLYAMAYEYVDSEYVELCRVEAGGSGTFTVSEAHPFIKIVITAQRFAGKSWNDEYIMVKPYLRRIEFKDKPYGVYVPSLHKQIATMDSSVGYNETQTDTVSDSIEEVTQ